MDDTLKVGTNRSFLCLWKDTVSPFKMFLEVNESHARAEDLLNEVRKDRKSDASPVEYMYVRRLFKYKKYLLNRTSKKTGKPLSPGVVHTYFSVTFGFSE